MNGGHFLSCQVSENTNNSVVYPERCVIQDSCLDKQSNLPLGADCHGAQRPVDIEQ